MYYSIPLKNSIPLKPALDCPSAVNPLPIPALNAPFHIEIMLTHTICMHEQPIRREEGGTRAAVRVSAASEQPEGKSVDNDRADLESETSYHHYTQMSTFYVHDVVRKAIGSPCYPMYLDGEKSAHVLDNLVEHAGEK